MLQKDEGSSAGNREPRQAHEILREMYAHFTKADLDRPLKR
jgi:hypothetical protein